MSEEKVPHSTAPQGQNEEPEGAPAHKEPRQGQQRHREKSVFQYVTVLFGAAFVLLLFTFMMERRQNDLLQQQNQEQIDDLQQSSISAVQSLNNLVNENTALKEQVEALEKQVAVLQNQADVLDNNMQHYYKEMSQQKRAAAALDWFWQIDEAYVRGRYTLCRNLIRDMEEAGLVEALPADSVTDTDRLSPAERYQQIYDKLF